MLVLLTISAAAVGMSVVIGEDNTATAEITPESPEITLESVEITLESMAAETELLNSGDTAVLGFGCLFCVNLIGVDCSNPANLGLKCNLPSRCKCQWCGGQLGCFPFDPF